MRIPKLVCTLVQSNAKAKLRQVQPVTNSNMLLARTKHRQEIAKKDGLKMRLRAKCFARKFVEMPRRKWSEIAKHPKWPLCDHDDINKQPAYTCKRY